MSATFKLSRWVRFAIGAALIAGVIYSADLAERDVNAMPVDADRGTAGLARWLRALETRASMLMIIAHPDDEDGGMLVSQTRGLGARAAVLTLTRGEGGQNAMSPDFSDALGLLRTQELLQADRFYGVDQYWGTVIDYGFSKTREEALAKWGYERVLADAVRVVRMTRPLVITSLFNGAPTDGHGQHQVSGQMAQEVFLAAGDPNRFPEQIREGLRPWKPWKVYARVPFFAPKKDNTIYDYATDKYVPLRFYDYVAKKWSDHIPSTDLEIPEGTLQPESGLTFLQIAREGWGLQKSQNGGATVPPPGLYSAPYHRYASRVATGSREKTFYDGIDISLSSIASLTTGGDKQFLQDGLTVVAQCVETAVDQYRPSHPASIGPALAQGLKITRELGARVRASSLSEPGKSDVLFELERKTEQFEKALNLALGLSFEATVLPDKEATGPFAAFGTQTTFTIAIPGQSFKVGTHLLNSSPETVKVEAIRLKPSGGESWKISDEISGEADLKASQDLRHTFAVTVPANAALVRPYFWRPNQEQPYYDIADERFRNRSLAPYPLWATARVAFHGVDWEMERVVNTNARIENVGNVQDPLITGPAISVSVSPAAGAVPLVTTSFAFTCTLHSNVKGPAKGTLRLRLPKGWTAQPAEYPFAFSRDGEEESLGFQISPGKVEQKQYEIRAVAEYGGKTYVEGYRMAGYAGLRPYPYYRPATYQATGVDVKTAPDLRVGYFAGTGDEVPRALADLGLRVQTLSGEDLANADLNGLSAIVLGVRAYSRPELRAANKRLLNYVKAGGVLIVQYNLQALDEDYGPYAFSLGSNPQKVVDENSQVKLLEAGSPALSWPNKITEADFSGWLEERGHGFMKTWDEKHYQALVETHDPDQDPQRGGLLLARYGEGYYVYDALALYRQLPSGVPGAYRILANLVSLRKNPSRN